MITGISLATGNDNNCALLYCTACENNGGRKFD